MRQRAGTQNQACFMVGKDPPVGVNLPPLQRPENGNAWYLGTWSYFKPRSQPLKLCNLRILASVGDLIRGTGLDPGYR